MMKATICKSILRLFGWRFGPIGKEVPKGIICVAPHTSNWDFIVGKLFYTALGRDAGFLIKKEWYFFPFNYIFSAMGGVPVDRHKATSITDQMVDVFKKRKSFYLGITPEGTRKKVKEWKKGFYFIAYKSNVPILLAYLDYKKKEAGIKSIFYPTGEVEKDIKTIRAFYRGVTGCHPENFVFV